MRELLTLAEGDVRRGGKTYQFRIGVLVLKVVHDAIDLDIVLHDALLDMLDDARVEISGLDWSWADEIVSALRRRLRRRQGRRGHGFFW